MVFQCDFKKLLEKKIYTKKHTIYVGEKYTDAIKLKKKKFLKVSK